MPWWKRQVYMEGLEAEFAGRESDPEYGVQQDGVPTRVYDLDEDGPGILSQFGMVAQAV